MDAEADVDVAVFVPGHLLGEALADANFFTCFSVGDCCCCHSATSTSCVGLFFAFRMHGLRRLGAMTLLGSACLASLAGFRTMTLFASFCACFNAVCRGNHQWSGVPLKERDRGKEKTNGNRSGANLGTLLREALAEEQRENKRARHECGKDPNSFKHGGPQPFISAMSEMSTLRRFR